MERQERLYQALTPTSPQRLLRRALEQYRVAVRARGRQHHLGPDDSLGVHVLRDTANDLAALVTEVELDRAIDDIAQRNGLPREQLQLADKTCKVLRKA